MGQLVVRRFTKGGGSTIRGATRSDVAWNESTPVKGGVSTSITVTLPGDGGIG